MNNSKKKVIYVATDEELKNPQYYRRLWQTTRNVPIPRRDWLDAIADAIRDFDGEILTNTGEHYNIPDIDETFGDDSDMRWISHFLASKAGQPLRFSKEIERLRLIDLCFRIEHADI